MDLERVGAHPATTTSGEHRVRFGLYLPGILPADGYQLRVLLIHEQDQFDREVPPQPVDLAYVDGDLGLWQAEVALKPPAARPTGRFGQAGAYLYRYQLLRGGQPVVFWFADPFARAAGIGSLSAFTVGAAASFAWTDAEFRVPEVDDLIVYELQVAEFNGDFDGVVKQLDYLAGLGVNAIELLPVTNVPEKVEWGYTPLGYFAPDDRLGGPAGMKRLVDACHRRGIAVIVDAVYGHCHPDFAYNLVYRATGVANPMMGEFAEQFAGLVGPDYTKEFAREFFHRVNEFWLDEYRVDGFRYDFVPGSYDGPTGVGYAELVHHTYHYSQTIPRFQSHDGRSRVLQVAEHLAKPREMLAKTYSNACWQNELLDAARGMARGGPIPDTIGHRLDPELGGYPATYEDPATGERLPVAPFQYLESHDHGRFVNEFGRLAFTDLVGEPYGDRALAYKTQPYAIALLTAKGIPMLWQGQELGENWGLPGGADPQRILFERPVHWEYFYDPIGKAMVRLYRILGMLRRRHAALGSRSHLHYEDDADHRSRGLVVYRRQMSAEAARTGEVLIVVLNFRNYAQEVVVEFPLVGPWHDLIDEQESHRFVVDVARAGERHRVPVPSNYGVILGRGVAERPYQVTAMDSTGSRSAPTGGSLRGIMTEVLGDSGGGSLRFISPSAQRLEGLTASESHVEPTIATVFWQIVAESPSFPSILQQAGASPLAVEQGQIVVVPHGAPANPRYDLLVLDPARAPDESTSAPCEVDPRDLQLGWERWREQHADEPIVALVGPDLAPAVSVAMRFGVVVIGAPRFEPTSAPNPPWGVGSPAGRLPASTAGVLAVDDAQRVGVTVAHHAVADANGGVVPPQAEVWVDGHAGTVVSEHRESDSCFVELPHLAGTVVQPLAPLIGESPGAHERAMFTGLVSGQIETVVDGWDFNVLHRHSQRPPWVYTPPITKKGDSGAALVSWKGYLLGFAAYRTAIDEPVASAVWVWAASVFAAHRLGAGPPRRSP